jgi:2-C-methyl-D-erythritol 4-phosphate cytidylyltransferase
MAEFRGSAVNVSAIVPLPITVADNKAAAFVPLAGQPPLTRVVRAMLGGVPESVVVAAAEPLISDVRESLAAHGLSSVGMVAVKGQGLRAHCVAAALEYLAGKSLSAHYVLIGDIRRPLASADLRDRVAAALRSGADVVMPALPLTDSVKAIDARGSVTGTLDRSTLRAVQYPRGFTVDQLSLLLAGRTSDEFDELEEALRAGASITIVEGDPDAFVTELPRDAAFVDAIIACRRMDPHRVDQ